MLTIDFPFNGAILNHRHGRIDADGLSVTVRGSCPPYGHVTVNGIPARIDGHSYTAPLALAALETDIVARYRGATGEMTCSVRVVFDRHSFPRYRVCLDDNSYFLRDIARKGYDSIFDCHYLALLQRLHREYGAKFSCNIYYEADDGFALHEFPDRYRGEWAGCADWLGLTFHARADKPDRPYQYASPDILLADMDLVLQEIERFAGPQSAIMPTVIHWGMVQPEALPALYARGVRTLSGYFKRLGWGYDVHYWLDDARCGYLEGHGRLKDFETGIVFSRVDIVVNGTPLDRIAPTLACALEPKADAEVIDILTHEQYFWDFYPAYLPDHPERLDAALRWVTDRGYRPVFFHEGLMGASV